MIGKMLNLLFGCHHRHITRPITPVSRHHQPASSYVACLECGKQFHYDTLNMRVGTAMPPLTANHHASGSFQSQF